MDNGEVVLRAEDLVAGYGDHAVLEGINLRVHSGEIVALLGPNGAGKTTLMMTLSGALTRIAGSIEILGRPVSHSMARHVRDGLALVAEDRSVFMRLTVRENLRLGRGSLDLALRLFPELEPRLDVQTGRCSGGEQQILALARVLAAKPRLLMVDELSTGLAPLVVERLLAAIGEGASQGVGVLLVEQYARKALRFADRGCVLNGGRIALEGGSDWLLGRIDELEEAYLGSSGTGGSGQSGRRRRPRVDEGFGP